MRTVFASSTQGHNVLIPIKLAIAICIGKAMDPGSTTAIDIHPEGSMGIEQTLSTGDFDIQFLYLKLAVTWINTIQALVSLVAGN